MKSERQFTMGGMAVNYQPVDVGGAGEIGFSHTIILPFTTAAIAEIYLSSFVPLAPSGASAWAEFVACTTDGSNPPLPASETFNGGSPLSGHARSIVIRNGLKTITFSIDVVNASANFVVNVFFFPSVIRGNL
jgi:hypothetical protein